MKNIPHSLRRIFAFQSLFFISLLFSFAEAGAQNSPPNDGKAVYELIKSSAMTGGSAEVSGLVLTRDRVDMTFSGTFYFSAAVQGHVTAAVFEGNGTFHATVPAGKFEQDNVKRLLNTDKVESDFSTAILRFSDDTFDTIGQRRHDAPLNQRAQELVNESDVHVLKQTGANIAERLTVSLLNNEKPGFFFGAFEGGKRGHFCLLMDYQNRIPVANFDINAGEKGMIYSYQNSIYGNNIWLAFYGLADYERRRVEYSDVHNLIDIASYKMYLDLTDPGKHLRLSSKINFKVLDSNLRALPFQIGESLGEEDNQRLKKQLRLSSVKMNGETLAWASAGTAGFKGAWAQEDWEGGFVVFLPNAVQQGQNLELDVALDGEFLKHPDRYPNCFYPRSNEVWYPRQGYFDRATFDLTFHHKSKLHIASVGKRISEIPDPDDADLAFTNYKMDQPVPLATFALGPFERHTETVKLEIDGSSLPLEFSSLPGSDAAIKEDFILAELNNSIRYFSLLFGKYPYAAFNAAFHPYHFGQGLPSLLMIPAADRANRNTYSFIAHETAHQWWGDVVMWRSYRDQWLSEGFAEYSGALYTGIRAGMDQREELIRAMRRSLKEPPMTETGMGKGRLADVGPIILGHRLSTNKTYGAYEALIYAKGALVLRMLHFLMLDPASGEDHAFSAMMTDFVNRYRDGFASTDDFRLVANEHFAKTPIAKKYNMKDLNWFFAQWVYQSAFPSYELEYSLAPQPDGTFLVSGDVLQKNAPDDWVMPLPIVFSFGEKRWASMTVIASGPKTPFNIKLPSKPVKVELDPQNWILSEKTSTSSK